MMQPDSSCHDTGDAISDQGHHQNMESGGHLQPQKQSMTSTAAPVFPSTHEDQSGMGTFHDDGKDCLSCSCSSTALSSTCSVSSASGLSSSPFPSQVIATQAYTPLSLEGSDFFGELDFLPGTSQLGCPPTPFDGVALVAAMQEVTSPTPENLGLQQHQQHQWGRRSAKISPTPEHYKTANGPRSPTKTSHCGAVLSGAARQHSQSPQNPPRPINTKRNADCSCRNHLLETPISSQISDLDGHNHNVTIAAEPSCTGRNDASSPPPLKADRDRNRNPDGNGNGGRKFECNDALGRPGSAGAAAHLDEESSCARVSLPHAGLDQQKQGEKHEVQQGQNGYHRDEKCHRPEPEYHPPTAAGLPPPTALHEAYAATGSGAGLSPPTTTSPNSSSFRDPPEPAISRGFHAVDASGHPEPKAPLNLSAIHPSTLQSSYRPKPVRQYELNNSPPTSSAKVAAQTKNNPISSPTSITKNSSQAVPAARDPTSTSTTSSAAPSCCEPFPAVSPPSSASSSLSILSRQLSLRTTDRVEPLVRAASDNAALKIQHPTPDINPRTGAYLGNIAQLEATAERLSTGTSSIEDAIRDLHAELKRSDSQRSAATRARATQLEADESTPFTPLTLRRPALLRKLSSSSYHSSTARRNTANTQPARYRPRSSSLNTVMQSTQGFAPYLSRTGPGKGSVRSVASGKLSLAEIAETEPIALNQHALDEADRVIATDEDDATIRPQTGQGGITPNGDSFPTTDAFHAMLNSSPRDEPNLHLGDYDRGQQGYNLQVEEPRPTTSRSTNSNHLNNAFGDFDGVHFEPEIYSPPPPMEEHHLAMPPPMEEHHLAMPPPMEEHHLPMPPPPMEEHHLPMPPMSPISPPIHHYEHRPPMPRPQSYLDPATGQEMLYYPARVPAMLSLPPKLSKKPKAAVRNQRQSRVLSAMPEASRKSAVWLPDPLAGHADSPFSPPLSMDDATPVPQGEGHSLGSAEPSPGMHAPEIHVTQTPSEPLTGEPAPADDDEVKPAVPRPRKSAVMDGDARKSRMSNLPPQLRASVFFDMPSTTANLEVKNGSATATLDDLLNASAHAPVSAFTDHLIAGKLGAEVYGPEKKRRSAMPKMHQAQPSADSTSKKRSTVLQKRNKSADLDHEQRAANSASPSSGEHAGPRTSQDEPLPPGAVGYATLSPDADEFSDHDGRPRDRDGDDKSRASGDEGSDNEDDEAYHGPPTTLLAELHIRKQQQKLRTRPINQAFPNGMHSTLLELDAVAEAQRKNRRGKKVNLAWEDPDMERGAGGESSDEDVPLGILYAAKAAGTNDLAAATADLDRPLGLMERREMEENEPLSRRRARLQGGGAERGAVLTKRDTLMLGGGGLNIGNNRLSQMPPGFPAGQASPYNADFAHSNPGSGDGERKDDEEDDEVEGETLGERMKRLKEKEEKELPQARPVSTAFSAELLSQFGDLEDEKDKKKEEEAVANGGDAEEEETLGQRRKRLQAEREAREGQLGGLAVPGARGHNYSHSHGSISNNTNNNRLSLAGILSAHPKREVHQQDAERLRYEEELHAQQAQQARMAAVRAQMPTSLVSPSVGAGTGGFRGGQFNDGTGGTGLRRVSSQGDALNGVEGGWGQQQGPGFAAGGMIQRAGVTSMQGGFGAGGYSGASAGSFYGGSGGMGTGMGMGMGMGMQQGGGLLGMQGGGLLGQGHMGMPMGMPMQQQMMPVQGMGMGPGMMPMNGMGPMNSMPMGMGMNMNMNMGMGMNMMGGPGSAMNPGGQTDRVERWRQGIL